MFGYIVRNRDQILYFSKCLLTNYLYHFMNNQPSFSNDFFPGRLILLHSSMYYSWATIILPSAL